MSEEELIRFDLKFAEFNLAIVRYYSHAFTPREYSEMIDMYRGKVKILKEKLDKHRNTGGDPSHR